MEPAMMDPDIAKVLRTAGIDPLTASDYQIAMADRLLVIHRLRDKADEPDLAKAAVAMVRYR
jgi:hypothetical protein